MPRAKLNPLSTLPAQRLRANPRDHIAAWLEEEFVLGDGYVRIGALFCAYELWCECRKVTNRRLTPVLLLDRLSQHYGIEARDIRFVEHGEERFVYALPGIRFRYDEALNRRLRYRGADTRTIGRSWREDDHEI